MYAFVGRMDVRPLKRFYTHIIMNGSTMNQACLAGRAIVNMRRFRLIQNLIELVLEEKLIIIIGTALLTQI